MIKSIQDRAEPKWAASPKNDILTISYLNSLEILQRNSFEQVFFILP
jgi:hypothetical protein